MSFIASPRKIPKQSFVFLSLSVTHDVISLPLPYMCRCYCQYMPSTKKNQPRGYERMCIANYMEILCTNTRHIIISTHSKSSSSSSSYFLFHTSFFFSFCYHDERWCIFMFVDALHKFVSLSFLTWYRTWWFGVKWNEAFLVICCCYHHDFTAIENHCEKCDKTCNFL